MKNGKRLKIMLSGLIMIQSFFLPYALPEAMVSTAFSDNSGGVLVAKAGQTDVAARIVSEDSEQTDSPQGDEIDGNTDGTGESAKVEDVVATGDDLSGAILLSSMTVISGIVMILFLSVRKRHTKNPCFR